MIRICQNEAFCDFCVTFPVKCAVQMQHSKREKNAPQEQHSLSTHLVLISAFPKINSVYLQRTLRILRLYV